MSSPSENRVPWLAAIGVAVAVGALAVVVWTRVNDDGGEVEHRIDETTGYLVSDAGCVDDPSARSIDAFLSRRIGPIVGVDAPNVYDLGDARYLWLFQDAYLDYSGTARTVDEAAYLHNVAIVQDENCFDVLHRGTAERPGEFQPDQPAGSGRFFWPLGGSLGADGRLYVFWSELQQGPQPALLDGISRHPVANWLAAYDPHSLERVSFEPAPDPGVQPQYGSAVASVDGFGYLFGNSNVLNLAIEGGFGPGPFSATREYLARVPDRRLDRQPEYRTGDGWSADPAAAAPISERFQVSNDLQPRHFDGTWVSVVKPDEFWGDRIVIETAPQPWGPWTVAFEGPAEPEPPPRVPLEDATVYHPILLPWREPDGRVVVVLSQNGLDPEHRDVRVYRPYAYAVDVGLRPPDGAAGPQALRAS